MYAKGCKTPTETDLQYRRKDHISHFILRLSHCFEPDNQTWFINQEVEFFKLRFNSLDKEGVEKLLSMHKIDCQQVRNQISKIKYKLIIPNIMIVIFNVIFLRLHQKKKMNLGKNLVHPPQK